MPSLDRRNIIGEISIKTPLVVLLDYINSRNLRIDTTSLRDVYYRQSSIDAILQKPVRVVEEPYTKDDLKYIAVYVNRNCRWDILSLVKAFNYLLTFEDVFVQDIMKRVSMTMLQQIPHDHGEYVRNYIQYDFNFGYQTPHTIYAVNISVLYAACTYLNLPLSFETTSEEMEYMLRLYLQPTPSYSLKMALSQVLLEESVDRTTLIKISRNLNVPITMLLAVSDNYEQSVNHYSNKERQSDSALAILIDPTSMTQVNGVGSVSTESNQNYCIEKCYSDTSNDSDNELRIEERGAAVDTQAQLMSTIEINDLDSCFTLDEDFHQQLTAAVAEVPTSLADGVTYKPSSQAHAIIAAALHYQLDITFVKDACLEYHAMQQICYRPRDKVMIKLYNSRVSSESPYLTENFNPYLPEGAYTSDMLRKLITGYGFHNQSSLNISTLYERLQLLDMCSSFYHGRQPESINQRITYSFTELNEHADYELVANGLRGQAMSTYTYEELLATFSNERIFLNPVTENPSVFIDQEIIKLRHLLSASQRTSEPDDHYELRQELLELIDVIKREAASMPLQIKQLKEVYISANNSFKSNLENCFRKLLEAAMAMRGWCPDTGNSYPITHATMRIPQDDIDVNVSHALSIFGEALNKISPHKFLFLDLPLYRWRRGTWIPSSTHGEKTIGERLDLVMRGKDGSISSCIRLSSNWFACSCHKYMTYMGWDPEFSVTDLYMAT